MKDKYNNNPGFFSEEELMKCEPGKLWSDTDNTPQSKGVTCLGMTFPNDEARRAYFRDELRKKLPELRHIEGFPIGEDDDIINLSDPPYYTACPNPWLNDFIAEWEKEKEQLKAEGKRTDDFEVKEPYASDVSEGKNNPIYMAHAYHTKVPHPAIMRYIGHYTQPGDIIFDGFAGTGMTGVAAGKCADKNEVAKYRIGGLCGKRFCILGDLSPIATFIAYNFNNPIEKIDSVIKKGYQIVGELRKKLGYLYKTKHTNGEYGDIIYVIWSDVLVCQNCGSELSYWKESLEDNNNIKKEITCPHCGAVVKKNQENIRKITVLSKSGVTRLPNKEPVLICYGYNGKRFVKEPDEYDFRLIDEIDRINIDTFYPINEIPFGVKTSELRRCGYTEVTQLYTKRNLIVFSALWESMKKYPILKFAITSILVKTGSLLHNIGLKNGKINLAGARPNALFVPSALAERNIFDLFVGKFKDIVDMHPESLHRSCIQVQSATDLSNIGTNTVDYIFTDPPFGHNLMYSELNFIHESWLKLYTNNEDEAIENSAQHKGVFDYANLMTEAFAEYYRILKPGKWMTVEFSNTSAKVWNAIQRSLTKAGFVVSVVRGLDKKQGSYNAQTSLTAVKQDLVISCYKILIK